MSYEKQTWSNLPNKTTPISAARLNHLETQYDEAVAERVASESKKRVANVLDFGADPTGEVSSSQPFSDALISFSGQGGTVVIPPGVYLMSDVVEIPSNTHIVGAGAVLLKAPGSPTAVFCTRSNGRTGYGSGGSNITIRGLALRGSFTPPTRNIGLGNFHHSDHVLIEDCTFSEALNYGHIIDLQGSRFVTINRCSFLGFNPSGGESRKYTEAIQLDYSTRLGASVADLPGSYDGLPTQGVTVSNSVFLPLTVQGETYPAPNPLGSHATVEGHFISGVRFKNNLVSHWGEDSVNPIRGALHFVSAKDVLIQDSQFESASVSSYAIGLHLLSRAFPLDTVEDPSAQTVPIPTESVSGVRVQGCTFTTPDTYTGPALIRINGHSSSRPISLTGNSFQGPTPSQFIEVFNAAGVTVSENSFRNSRRAVYAQGCSFLTAQGNHSLEMSIDVFNISSGSAVAISGNTSENCGAVVYSTSSEASVTGNVSRKTGPGAQVAYDLNNAEGVALTSNSHTHLGGGSPIGFRVRGSSAGVVTGNVATGCTISTVPGVTEGLNKST